jgi:putative glutamine amidotransferase
MKHISPLIGVPCCRREINEQTFHAVAEKYATAITVVANGVPLLIPPLGDKIDLEALVDRFDGFLVTGSPSNVEPHHYDGEPSIPGTKHDAARDATTLPLIRLALTRDVPLLAICRGIQELNVALGGTLHQQLHEVPGRRDHRSNKELPVEERYAHMAHPVRLVEGGLLHRLAGIDEIMVNSLHGQGIDRLAAGLVVEAVAPDGLIEAVRSPVARFAVGVQWHPEALVTQQEFARRLFETFAAACRERAASRRGPAERAA